MRITATILVLLIVPFTFGQKTVKEKKTKTIIEERVITLNGGLNASLGGQSRVVIDFDLPKNTVEWYYSFSTFEGASGKNNLKLAIQLGSLLADYSGTTSQLLKQIDVPSGISNADVFLLNMENRTAFLEKWDNNGGTFYHISEGTAQKTKQAVVRVDDVLQGRYCLGLRNPSTLDGISINIEITAVIQEDVYYDEWVSSSRERIKSSCMESFAVNNSGKSEVCDCVNNKLSDSYKPSIWMNKTEASRLQIINELKEACYAETNNTELRDAEVQHYKAIADLKESSSRKIDFVNKMLSESRAAAQFKNYDEAIKKLSDALDSTESLDGSLESNVNFRNNAYLVLYNGLSWYSLLNKDMAGAQKHLQSGLAFAPEDMSLWINMGNYHLLNNNYREAEKAFTRFKRREKFVSGRKFVDVIAEDLDIMEEHGLHNENFDKIRSLLKIK